MTSRIIAAESTALHVGDIVLTGRKSQGIVSLAIKLGQKLRFGFKSNYTIWAHCAIVVSTDAGGYVAEAVSSGVKINKMSERYPPGDFAIIPTGAHIDSRDMGQVMDFVNAVVKSKYKYGFWTFAGLALYCLTGSKLCIQKAGTAICSGFVCDAYTRTGVVWKRPPYAMTPADIAEHYEFHYVETP